MKEIIVIAIILIIITLSIFYIIKSKKSGKKCIGCPYSSSCANNNNEKCNCKKTQNININKDK